MSAPTGHFPVDHTASTRVARSYAPSDPELDGLEVLPFRVARLQDMPGAYCDVYKALSQLLPGQLFEPGFRQRMAEILSSTLELDIDLWLDAIQLLSRSELPAVMPGVTSLSVIGLLPASEKLLLELDLQFAYRAVDQLLGGYGLSVDSHRPMTDVEEGVLSYLLLKLLEGFQSELGHEAQVAVRLEDQRSTLLQAADILRRDAHWLMITWKMNVGLDIAMVRVFVPMSLATRAVGQAPPYGSPAGLRLRAHKMRQLHRLSGVPFEGRVRIGDIELRESDLRALEAGDIVLLDHASAAFVDGQLEGRARLGFGLDPSAEVLGRLLSHAVGERERLIFEVEAIEQHPKPRVFDPEELRGEAQNPEDAMAEFEASPMDEADDNGQARARDILDEDRGIEDENMGDDEAYDDEPGAAYDDEQDGVYDDAQGEAYDDEEALDEAPDEPLVEAEALLADLPVHLSVEIGRVQLTADEILQLSAGHLIELGRSPREPVDLVAFGKLLAKGELVEIEGSLGVRVLRVAKEPSA